MSLVFEQIRAGGDRNFGYLLGERSSGRAVLIDPSFSPEVFVQRARDQGLIVTHIVNTHGHPDHTNGNLVAASLTGAAISAFADSPMIRPDVGLVDGQALAVGSLRLQFMHVPGHCPDHHVVYEPGWRLLVTGDQLFVGKVGGTTSDDDARTEWSSLQKVFERVPDDATVWPGHDYGARPSSTIGLERATNPFLGCADVDAFIAFKRDWPSYKQRLGLR
jgi:glyoxylase-like metal-dependent hydrolase (beta-lactamase superfamily II)